MAVIDEVVEIEIKVKSHNTLIPSPDKVGSYFIK